ncbi:MAG: acyltransferase [Flavobacteriaceae bacterium]|nr:MAG: acyltransferase [Flavobacteriaceae bacterium]
MQNIAKFIFFTILGWRIENDAPLHLKKYVIIAAPHTSWQDFPVGIFTKWVCGFPANFIGKASIFKPPFGFIFKALGGVPVDRSKSANMVDAIVDVFNSKEQFVLALAPEGTREKVAAWKTGFYYIAKGAKVPVVMIGLDFEHKKVVFSEPYMVTENKEKDFMFFYDFFRDIKGKHPERYLKL